jgi:hypothetical protein
MRDTEFEVLKLLMKKVHQHVADLEAENARLKNAARRMLNHIDQVGDDDDLMECRALLVGVLSQGQTGEGD